MTKKLLFAGFILLAVTALVMAADAVSGKWTWEQAGRDGGPGRPQSITLKADGANLTGTVSGGMGGRMGGGAPGAGGPGAGGPPPETAISNGKVNGNTVTFEVTREFGGNTMTTKYEGVVAGTEMKLKITRTGQDGTPRTNEVTAKKAN
jgi:hypothetical protein